jgi:hypothetical protein
MPVVGRGDKQAIERLVVDEVAVVLGVGLEFLEAFLAHHFGGAFSMGGGHIAAECERQLPRFHRGSRFSHDLQAAALGAADSHDPHGEAIVGGSLLARALLLGGEELPGVPGRQPAGGKRCQRPFHESSSR